jgi:hypothetical protein
MVVWRFERLPVRDADLRVSIAVSELNAVRLVFAEPNGEKEVGKACPCLCPFVAVAIKTRVGLHQLVASLTFRTAIGRRSVS